MARIGITEWNDRAVVRSTSRKTRAGLYEAAKIIERHVKRKFQQRTYGTGTGELFRAIKIKRSKYKDDGVRGYIVGVFGGKAAKWEDSLGARAIFFEFGRAAPGHARSADKVQPPRPFFRPGLISARREIKAKLGLSSKKK